MAGIDLLTGHVHALVKERHRSREFIEFLKLLDAAYPADTACRSTAPSCTGRGATRRIRPLPSRFRSGSRTSRGSGSALARPSNWRLSARYGAGAGSIGGVATSPSIRPVSRSLPAATPRSRAMYGCMILPIAAASAMPMRLRGGASMQPGLLP